MECTEISADLVKKVIVLNTFSITLFTKIRRLHYNFNYEAHTKL